MVAMNINQEQFYKLLIYKRSAISLLFQPYLNEGILNMRRYDKGYP